MPTPSSPEAPLPVRTVARLIGEWVARLGQVWVEGQVTQMTRRPGAAVVFLTLRDPHADVSLAVRCDPAVVDRLRPPLGDGARVVLWGRPELYAARGSLALTAYDIRPVGVGELLARIERLKAVLAAEGMFSPGRKRRLPFLPRTVGLVCGRASAAERDVLDNASRRWPAVQFRVEAVPVQGPYAVSEIMTALRRLDADPAVDVLVLARGGGSVEDLLPFSDEALLRTVADLRTPLVSAIGHEQDTPLLDLVADRRASTPTDAGKLVVPDVREERLRVEALRDRARRVLGSRLDREQALLDQLGARPVLAHPARELDRRAGEVAALRARASRCAVAAVGAASTELRHTEARLGALSPADTLARGYAVVQRAGGAVLRAPSEVTIGDPLRLRLARGELSARVVADGSAAAVPGDASVEEVG